MKFTKQYNLRIKRAWISNAVDVQGVKQRIESGKITWQALGDILREESGKAQAFLSERTHVLEERVGALRLPSEVRRVVKETKDQSDEASSIVAGEQLSDGQLREIYKSIRSASLELQDLRDFQVMQGLALRKLVRKYIKVHYPPPAKVPFQPELAAIAGSDVVFTMGPEVTGPEPLQPMATPTPTPTPAGDATPLSETDPAMAARRVAVAARARKEEEDEEEEEEEDDEGTIGKALHSEGAEDVDALGQVKGAVREGLEAVLREVDALPLFSTEPLDALDQRMEDVVAAVPARWRQRRRPSVVEPVVPTVTKLVIDTLPVGAVTRLKLALGTNYLGYPHSLPVIVARGASAGPTVVITSAVHGNELNGIPLVHSLLRDLDIEDLHGTLVAVPVVNVSGYVRQQRAFHDGVDINRIMPGKPEGTCSQQFAHKLTHRLLSKADFVIDLHTASFGRINSLYVRADMIDPVSKQMALLQRPQIVVHSTGPDGSLRGECMNRGVKAITVEIGDPHQFSLRFVGRALQGVHNILSFLKVLPAQEAAAPAADEPEEEQPVVCSRSFWMFTREGGVLYVYPELCQWVRKGEVIAEIFDLFGDLMDRYFAPEDGIIVGKNVNPVAASGDRIAHIGVVTGEFAKDAQDGH